MAKEYITRDTLDKWLDLTMLAQGTVAGKAYVRMFWDKVRSIPAADVVEVVRCQNCVHAEPFERNCELNSCVYMHCARGRGEEVRNVWHKYKKYYRDYSVVDRDGYCDEGERKDDNAAD